MNATFSRPMKTGGEGMTSSKSKSGNKYKGSVKNKKSKEVSAPRPNFTNSGNARYQFRKIDDSFHLKLKHILGGVSLISLLAAFEVFSIPAANGIVDILALSNFMAGMTWFFVAVMSGGIAVILDEEET